MSKLEDDINQVFSDIKANEELTTKLLNSLQKGSKMTFEQALEATELMEEGDRLHKHMNTLLKEYADSTRRRG